MGPAAGIEVDPGDLHQADVARVALRQTPRPHRKPGVFLRAHPPRGDGPGRADLGRDRLFQPRELFGGDLRRVQLDIRDLLAEVKSRRVPTEPLLGHGGQQMLARVLLHMVEPTRPVQLDQDAPGRRRSAKIVSDQPLHAAHILHRDPRNPAAVGGLAAPLRIEDGVRQDDERTIPFRAGSHDLGLQRNHQRLALIGGHRAHTLLRSRYEITCPFIGISLRLLMPFPEFLRSSYSLTTAHSRRKSAASSASTSAGLPRHGPGCSCFSVVTAPAQRHASSGERLSRFAT